MTEPALGMIAVLARVLNSAADATDTLGKAAATLRTGLGAERVIIWRRDPGAGGFVSFAAPEGRDPSLIASLDRVKKEGTRVPLGEGTAGGPLGLLQVVGGEALQDPVLEVAADLLSPYLRAEQRSEAHAWAAVEHSRAVEEARRFTELIIDSLPVGLYVVDRDYRIQVWNRKRELGTQGLRRGEVVGRPVFDVLTRQPREQLRAEFDSVFEAGELQQTDMEVETPDGLRVYRLTRIPMRLDGDEITHVITIGEDVSEWREVQAHILQSEKLAALGQLAAGVMHEINNPLATIGACVAATDGRLGEVSGPGEPAVREYLSIIDREVERCTSIVDGLLDFSRPKGKAKAPASLNRIVDETLGLLRHHKRFKAVTLTRDLDESLPDVIVNAEQIVQVLMALSINALDAMEGGGRLAVRTGRSRRRGDHVFVEVEDSGPGIGADVRSKIFEPFFTTKAPGRGTGLGLSICYGIVEEHRGRIEVDTLPGRGAIFRVSLPVDA